MGNQDAPKAPAGWYPIEEGKPGERYWDGNSWTGEERGIPEQHLSPESLSLNRASTYKKTLFLAIGFFAALIFALTIILVVNNANSNSNASNLNKVDSDATVSCEKGSTCYNKKLASGEIEPDRSGSSDGVFGNGSSVVPAGFTDAGNGMSFKFIDGTCSYFKCSYVQIYSDSSCSNVYVEANTIDDNGTIFGMTNDMIGAMNPGDSAVAELNVLEDGATGVKLTKIQCY